MPPRICSRNRCPTIKKFAELVHDILDDIRSRFELVDSGELRRRRSGWPESWVFATQDRDEFIREVRRFSSNYAPHFGRLLTPLVDGIRVRGPLFPAFGDLQPRLVLLDGQDLGHTPESSSSVTTHITRRYQDVDVVLLVDSSQHPMQAAPWLSYDRSPRVGMVKSWRLLSHTLTLFEVTTCVVSPRGGLTCWPR